MRAIVFPREREVELWDLAAVDPGPGEIQLRTLVTGVSGGTERHILLGGPYSAGFPVIPGYQTVGEVVAVGEGVEWPRLGDVVFSDGGHKPPDFDGLWGGGHMELRTRPVGGNIFPVGTLPYEEAAMLGVMGIGMLAVRRADVRIGERVHVIGLGLIGLACVGAAVASGAIVTASDLSARRRDLAERLGAEISDDWQNGSYDAVFEASGAPGMPDLGIRALRADGRFVVIAGRHEMTYRSIESGQMRIARIIHTSHFGPDDMRAVAALVGLGRMQIRPLISDVVPVADAPALYGRLANDPEPPLGIVFDWRSS